MNTMSEIPKHWRMQTVFNERYNLTGQKYEDGSVSLFHGPNRPRVLPNGNHISTPIDNRAGEIKEEPIKVESTGQLILTADSGVIFQQQD